MWGYALDAVEQIEHVKDHGHRIEALAKLQELLGASGVPSTHNMFQDINIVIASNRFAQWVNEHYPKPTVRKKQPKLLAKPKSKVTKPRSKVPSS